MAAFGIQISHDDLAAFLRACDEVPRDMDRTKRATLRKVGELVRVEAKGRMLVKHRPTAAGYVTRVVRSRSVRIEQSIPKTTGLHPSWGRWQLRHALLPALLANEDEIEQEFRRATDRVCDRFERGR